MLLIELNHLPQKQISNYHSYLVCFQHGYLHTDQGHFMIEPMKMQHSHNTSHDHESNVTSHPHLVYNRQSLPIEWDIARKDTAKIDSHPCGVESTVNPDLFAIRFYINFLLQS